MKSTGIVRPLDNLGRIVVPIELRRVLNIGKNDSVEIYSEGESIVMRKYEPTCTFCQNADELVEYKEKLICSRCMAELGLKAQERKD